jgi:hypothetical protein
MLALNRSLLNRGYTLMNVLKALAFTVSDLRLPFSSLQLDWCPHHITSGRTQQKTPPPTILLLLWVVA